MTQYPGLFRSGQSCFQRRLGRFTRFAAGSLVLLAAAGCSDKPTTGLPMTLANASAAASAGRPAPVPSRAVGFVRLEALSEISGKPWISVAEFNLLDATGADIDRQRWKASADSAGAIEQPAYAIDGDTHSMWHTAWNGASPPPPHSLTVDLGAPTRVSGFRYLPRQDNTTNGTIGRYRFYVSNDGVNWGAPVAEGDFSTLGAPTLEKTVVFGVQTVNHPPALETPVDQSVVMGRAVSYRLHAVDSDGDALTFVANGLPTGLSIDAATGTITGTPIVPGSYLANLTVTDNKGAAASSQVKWDVAAPVSAAAAASAPTDGSVRFVRLEELTEINGGVWASMAEFNLLDAEGKPLPRTGWIASADSAGLSEAAAYAIDNNKASMWHTQWAGVVPPPPHSFIVDLGTPTRFSGFRYTPRQDNTRNGTIAKYRFYVSQDGVNWGRPVAEGDFSADGQPTQDKTVTLK